MELPVFTEEIFKCLACGHNEAWTTEPAAHAAASWHVHDAHPEIWRELFGDRDPEDPLPDTLGRQFAEWERQG